MTKSSQRARAIAIDAALVEQPFGPFRSMLAVTLGSLGLWAVVISLGYAMVRML